MKYDALDDLTIELGGYIEMLTSFSKKKYKMIVTTEYIEGQTKRPAPFTYVFDDMCEAFLVPKTNWYHFTKLWTDCPPQKGVSF